MDRINAQIDAGANNAKCRCYPIPCGCPTSAYWQPSLHTEQTSKRGRLLPFGVLTKWKAQRPCYSKFVSTLLI